MKSLNLILFIVFLFPIILLAQVDTLWTKLYGDNEQQSGHSVQQTSDGGFFIVGSYRLVTEDTSFVYLMKTDSDGDTAWTNMFSCDSFMCGHFGEETSEGGYIAVGNAGSSQIGTSTDGIFLIRTDENGDSLWTRNYLGNIYYSGNEVHQTTDGGYIIVGYTELIGYGEDDVLLIKTDSEGDTLWTRTYGTSNMDHGSSVKQTADGGYIISGESNYQYGGFMPNVYLVKTNSDGDTIWTKQFEYPSGAIGLCVCQTTDGGYIVTGHTYTFASDRPPEILLIKTDANGDTLWTRLYGEEYDLIGYDVEETFDGGFIIGGDICPSWHNPMDIFILKVNSNGDSLWGKILGGDGGDWTRCIRQTQDGGFIISGATESFGPMNLNVWLIRLSAEGAYINEPYLNSPTEFVLFPPFPNPFNQRVSISYKLQAASYMELKVYDITGREVAKLVDGYESAGNHEMTFDAEGLTSGVYFVRLEAGDFIHTQKLLLVK